MTRKIELADIDYFHGYDLYVPTRTIYIGSGKIDDEGNESGVDAALAERVIKDLHILDHTSPEGSHPINIILNCVGGDYYHGMAIYNAIKACKNHVTCIVRGHAMSMGSVILQAADERILSEDARIMIHYGEDGYDGHSKDFQKYAEEAKGNLTRLENIYLEKIKENHPRYNRKKLSEYMAFDVWLKPKLAIELGLADKMESE